jgi:hypothetical protein
MQLSPLTIDRLKTFIIGDGGAFPRLTGPDILQLFHQVGFKDVYDHSSGGMPGALSRKNYAAEKLKEINGRPEMQRLLESVVSKAHFLPYPGLDYVKAIEVINAILAEDGYNFVEIGDGKYKVSGAVVAEAAVIQAHFTENREKIIEEIRKARFLIWVAVAWLTDKKLLSELRKKKDEGLNIQIVTQDDEINATLKDPVMHVFEAYYKQPGGKYKNLMHHKFCIIDLKTVVHGSYNWTTRAQYNEETVTVNHSTEFAAEFASRFIELKKA